MGDKIPTNSIERVEFDSTLHAFSESIVESIDDIEQKRSTEIAVQKHIGGLQSVEDVRKASSLYREFIEDREYDPHPALIAAVGSAVVFLAGKDDKTSGVIAFHELFSAGDLGVSDTPSKEDIDTVDVYLTQSTIWGLNDTDMLKLAGAFGIPRSIRGLELMRNIVDRIEEGQVTSKLLFDLGIIDSETYEQYRKDQDEEDAFSIASLDYREDYVDGGIDEEDDDEDFYEYGYGIDGSEDEDLDDGEADDVDDVIIL